MAFYGNVRYGECYAPYGYNTRYGQGDVYNYRDGRTSDIFNYWTHPRDGDHGGHEGGDCQDGQWAEHRAPHGAPLDEVFFRHVHGAWDAGA